MHYMKNRQRDDRHRSTVATPTDISPTDLEEGGTWHCPAFIRLPKPGERCAWTGLSRGSLNDLILGPDPKVKSLVLARPGAKRGVRLISLCSLLDYLERLMADQALDAETPDNRHAE